MFAFCSRIVPPRNTAAKFALFVYGLGDIARLEESNSQTFKNACLLLAFRSVQ